MSFGIKSLIFAIMQENKLLQKMQQKVLNVLAPLSKIWQKIEDST